MRHETIEYTLDNGAGAGEVKGEMVQGRRLHARFGPTAMELGLDGAENALYLPYPVLLRLAEIAKSLQAE